MTTIDRDQVAVDRRVARPGPSSSYFLATTIDDSPELLQRSYELRYQVYCLEREFLNAENYPEQVETDEYDAHAIHVGALDAAGTLAGTARVITQDAAGLPVFGHCTLFPNETDVYQPGAKAVEVGRLSVSRRYNRRAQEQKTGYGDVFLTLLKALYQATKRIGGTHWLAATERPLQRMLAQYGFPFRLAGPESDYFGMVAPYVLDIAAFDAVILSNRFPLLRDFWVGLEPEFLPDEIPDDAPAPLSIAPTTPVPGDSGDGR